MLTDETEKGIRKLQRPLLNHKKIILHFFPTLAPNFVFLTSTWNSCSNTPQSEWTRSNDKFCSCGRFNFELDMYLLLNTRYFQSERRLGVVIQEEIEIDFLFIVMMTHELSLVT